MPETAQPRSAPAKNPYIMNFCKVLVEKKGGELQPEALKKLLGDMYRLFECMLGQNMIAALPEDLRKEYLGMSRTAETLTTKRSAISSTRACPITRTL